MSTEETRWVARVTPMISISIDVTWEENRPAALELIQRVMASSA